ncbi:hypothetical protein [Streptomyces sp. bgisy095]|uniref:hypothetical protein n=1 Tax=unclassified Streptomyces TaxID=2593676 RepID=UPI003D76250C
MSPTRTVRAARTAAVCYVVLISAAALGRVLLGDSGDALRIPLYFLTFPGSLLVSVLVLLPLHLLVDDTSATAHPVPQVIYFAVGAGVNVFLVYAAARVVRRLRRTSR